MHLELIVYVTKRVYFAATPHSLVIHSTQMTQRVVFLVDQHAQRHPFMRMGGCHLSALIVFIYRPTKLLKQLFAGGSHK